MNSNDDYNINFKKFTRFDKKMPWPFAIKILIAILIIVGLYLAKRNIDERPAVDSSKGYEIEILYQ